MIHQPEPIPDHSSRGLRAAAVVLGATLFITGLLLALAVAPVPESLVSPVFGVLTYAVLYTILVLFAYTLDQGLEIGLHSLAVLAAYITFGPLAAIATSFLGAAFAATIDKLLGILTRRPTQRARAAIVMMSHRAGVGTLAMLFAGGIYRLLGGPEIVDQITADMLIPLAALFIFNFLLNKLPRAIMLVQRNKITDLNDIRDAIPELMFAELFPLPLAVLLSISYYRLPPAAFLLELGGAIVSALLFRESQRSRTQLRRRVHELSIINSFGQAISSRLSFQDLIENFHKQITEIIPTPIFWLVTYDQDSDDIAFPLVVEYGQQVARTPKKGFFGVSRYVIKTRKPLFLRGNVTAQLQAMGIQQVGPERRCILALPLIAEDAVIGLFALESETDSNAFTIDDMAILGTIATQGAIAIRNATLYKRLTEFVDELALLNNVSSVTSTLDLDEVLQTTSKVVTSIGKADKIAIFLHEERDRSVYIAHAVGLSDVFVAQFNNLSASVFQPFAGEQDAIGIPDVHIDPRLLGWRTLADLEGFKGMLVVPLMSSTQVVGYLITFYTEVHTFNRNELYVMNTLANQIAITVSNARLYQDTQLRAQEMFQLADAARTFAETLDLDTVAKTALDKVGAMLAPDLMALMLGEKDGTLHTIAYRGAKSPERLRPTGSLTQAMVTGKALTLPNKTEDLELLTQLGLRSLYAVPLLHQAGTFGIMLIGHEGTRWYQPRERQLVEALINQATVAIRNAQRYEQADEALEDRVTELSAIESISRKISASLDLDEIINAVLDVVERTTGADSATCALISEIDRMSLVPRYSNSHPAIQTSISIDEGVVGRVMRTGKPARISDTRDDPDYVPPYGVTYLSELCIPIERNNERVGVINIESHALDAFTESHEKFLINVAEHAAIAIENARLFEGRQRQIDILIEFRNLSLELLSANSIKQVLSLLVEYALLIAGARDVSLYLYDKSSDRLNFGASLWTDGRENYEASPLARGGMPYVVVYNGKQQTISEMTRDQITSIYQHPIEIGALATIAIKRSSNYILGVLNVAYQTAHHFTDDELRVLELLANQAAIAIEDIRLFDDVRQRRDQMQVILDSARDGMILIGPNTELIISNLAADRLVGYPLRRYVGRGLLRQIIRARHEVPDIFDTLVEHLHELLKEINEAPDKATRRTLRLNSVDIEETTLPVLDSANRPAGRLVVLRDISEEKSLERFRNEVTDMMVHDLRSPLGNVISCLRYLQEMNQIKQYDDFELVISTALSSSDDQMRMIESVLEIARLENNRMPLNPGIWNLNAVADRAIRTLEATASEAGVHLLNQLPTDLPLLKIDEDQVRRVLLNLMDNALRHTPSKGEVRIEAEVLENKRQVQVGVIDTGKGIPVESRARVFEKFVQMPKSAIRGRRGIGLGLTFCKLVVEAHGGHIWVDAGPEGGAAFWFTLPISRDAEAPLPTIDAQKSS
jgi:GAF domain-containing protein